MRRLALVLFGVVLVATGCAAPTRPYRTPRADLSGRWLGTWSGYGVMGVPRTQEARAELVQSGSRGTGSIVLENSLAAESVPELARVDGMRGTRVVFEVSGNDVVMRDEVDGRLFVADLKLEGDRLVGQIRDADPAVLLQLAKVKPPAPAPVEAAPAPTPPAPPAPVPRKAPEPVATAPAQPARPEPKDFDQIAEVKPIYFDFDKYEIRPPDADVVKANAEWLRANPGALVLIEGHCDERGTNEYNLALGERRARAARTALISYGVAADRISIVSLGEERPACTDRTEACWSMNRRAVFLIKLP